MRFTVDRLDLHTHHPFIIARGGGSRFVTLRLQIEAGGLTGAGEGAPSPYYGESTEITEAALARLAAELPERNLGDLDAEGIAAILAEAEVILGGNASAKAALDGALWDLLGKQRGEPVWRLIGMEAEPIIRSSFTVAIAEPGAMIARARAAVAAGFGALKLKVGFPGDVELVEQIATVIGKEGASLRVDANGGWTAAEAPAKMERLAVAGVEFVEQPLPWDDLAGYRAIAGRCPLPIVLDETVRGPVYVDLFGEYVDGVNLKISKLGGISACLAVAERARLSGLHLMMGCMIESSLGIAQALQLAPLLRWADLDGCLLIDNDPHTGLSPTRDEFRAGEAPGLGIERRAR